MKDINNQNKWTFELGSQEGLNVPVWILFGFQPSDGLNSAMENNDSFIDLQSQELKVYAVRENILTLEYYQTIMLMFVLRDMVKLKKLLKL